MFKARGSRHERRQDGGMHLLALRSGYIFKPRKRRHPASTQYFPTCRAYLRRTAEPMPESKWRGTAIAEIVLASALLARRLECDRWRSNGIVREPQ